MLYYSLYLLLHLPHGIQLLSYQVVHLQGVVFEIVERHRLQTAELQKVVAFDKLVYVVFIAEGKGFFVDIKGIAAKGSHRVYRGAG